MVTGIKKGICSDFVKAFSSDYGFDNLSVHYRDDLCLDMDIGIKIGELVFRHNTGISNIKSGICLAESLSVDTMVFPAETDEALLLAVAELCKKNKIKIALENGLFDSNEKNAEVYPSPVKCSYLNELLITINKLNDKLCENRFCACLNVGHGVIFDKNVEEWVGALGDKLGSVHISDNYRMKDYRLPPFRGRDGVDVDAVIRSLKNERYRGTVYLDIYEGVTVHFPTVCIQRFEFMSSLLNEILADNQ